MGAALFEPATGRLLLMADAYCNGGFDVFSRIMGQFNIVKVLLPTENATQLERIFPDAEIRPNSEFNYKFALAKLNALEFGDVASRHTENSASKSL